MIIMYAHNVAGV